GHYHASLAHALVPSCSGERRCMALLVIRGCPPSPQTIRDRTLQIAETKTAPCRRSFRYRYGGSSAARRPATARSLLGVGLDVINGLLHGGDLLGVLVRDLGLELFLEGHHQLDGVERVGAQVVHERGIRRDF